MPLLVMRMLKLIASAGLLLVLLWPLSTSPVRGGGHAWCDYTGSSQSWTTWPLGIRTHHQYNESRIETVIKRKRPGGLKHKWSVYCSSPDHDIFGHPIGAEAPHPPPPPKLFNMDIGTLNVWLKFASEEQIESLYDVLCREDPHEVSVKMREVDRQWKAWSGPGA
jgi:hypothetical protein